MTGLLEAEVRQDPEAAAQGVARWEVTAVRRLPEATTRGGLLAEPLGAAQTSLVEEVSAESEVAQLVDRLTVKLGPEKVRRPQPRESHLPERASGWSAAVSSPALAGEGDQRSWWRGPSVALRAPPPLEIEGRKTPPPTPARSA